jgi:NitT/TauT family transport system ATP-binding protein
LTLDPGECHQRYPISTFGFLVLIRTANLNKTYQTQRGDVLAALKDINLEINDGDFVSVVGPSGCGKSTLLKVLAGLIPYSAGDVWIDQCRVDGPNQRVGVVFQDPLLLEWRTVVENIMLPVQVLRLPYASHLARCHELLSMSGLDNFASSYPGELSGGMQQRVAICRALVFDPEILLMDEPFGALDAMTRDYMNLELLRLWQQSRKTILLITHSISEAVFLSDRVYVMSSRPGTIRDVVDIRLPRPRSLDHTATVEFGTYVARIRRHFTEMFDQRVEQATKIQPLARRMAQ